MKKNFYQTVNFIIHDLRNSVATLSLIVENSMKNIKNEIFLKESFAAINKEVKNMLEIIDILTQIRKVIQLEFEKTDINNLIIESLKKFKFPNIKVTHHLGEIPLVECDAKHMETVFYNIIKNSIEAMPDGGVLSVTTKFIPKYPLKRKPRDCVEITFSDTGCGISEKFQEDPFKLFETTKNKGLGIGLYQCREIIKSHKGTIEVKARAKKGAEVNIILPVEQHFIDKKLTSIKND